MYKFHFIGKKIKFHNIINKKIVTNFNVLYILLLFLLIFNLSFEYYQVTRDSAPARSHSPTPNGSLSLVSSANYNVCNNRRIYCFVISKMPRNGYRLLCF